MLEHAAASLLVGLAFAKSLAWTRGVPLVPVHHLAGHVESLVLENGELPLPSVVLVVSGGHTSLYRVAQPGAYELLGHESLQTFSGSGYLQDYPLEQYVRDAKIDTLYEGTTAIQSLDLVFRKIVKDGGRALGVVSGEIKSFLAAESGNGQLKEERLALATALGDIEGMLVAVHGWLSASPDDPTQVYKVGLSSRRILLALGDLVVGWLLQRQAEVALAALGRGDLSESDRHFYQGKLASAKFFAREVLPRLGSDRRIVEGTTLDIMDLPEEAF